jgi:hypothetical protein
MDNNNFEIIIKNIVNKTYKRKQIILKVGNFFRGRIDKAIKAIKEGRQIGVANCPSSFTDVQTKKLLSRIIKQLQIGLYPTMLEVKLMV